ncbi:unnamed protein product, partial [Sphenostylis stenocarpa]
MREDNEDEEETKCRSLTTVLKRVGLAETGDLLMVPLIGYRSVCEIMVLTSQEVVIVFSVKK